MKSELWHRLEVVYASDIDPPLRKAVLIYLAFRAQSGWAWPHQATIAEAVGITEAAARRHIAALEAAGWITEKSRRPGGRGVQYRLFDVSFIPHGDRAPVRGEPVDRAPVRESPRTSGRSDRAPVRAPFGSISEGSGRPSPDLGAVAIPVYNGRGPDETWDAYLRRVGTMEATG